MNTETRSRRHAYSNAALAMILSCGLSATAQVAPPLGQAADFAVLGATAVTNTGATVIDGDLGIWPNTASSITGFPPGIVNGTAHAGDAVAQQAQGDLTTAYNALAGQPCDVDLSGQDLGGLTLAPAVYCFSTAAQLTGTLTLDAQGNAAAVFIFQIGSTLTTASNSRVEIIGGGNDCNVFWQVGSSATLGTTSSVAGSILALASITLNSGASVTGRALARTGAVTLDGNRVALCALCPDITLAPETLPHGSLGSPYSQFVVASGGASPYSYSLTLGSLPPGLLLDPTSGRISGVPGTVGSFTFTVGATDVDGCFGSRIYTIAINDPGCPPILVQPKILPAPRIGEAYAQTVSASGGAAPYVFAISGGALPQGLLLSAAGPSEALLSGVPTTAGSYTFTVTATDADGCIGTRTYTVIVQPRLCPIVTILPTLIAPLVANQAYSQIFTASGGTSPYVFSVSAGALPAGLLLGSTGPTTATISGTPETAQAYAFTLTAIDADGCIGTQGYQGSVTVVATVVPVPTLSQRGMWALMLLLPLMAVVTLRR